MKRICCSLLLGVITIAFLFGCGDKSVDASVLQEIKLDDKYEISITEDFISEFENVDYKDIFDSKTDKVIISYTELASYPNELFTVKYYSVRDIQGSDVGYIMACIEETAWLLWGEFDIVVHPIVYSGFHYYNNTSDTAFDCLYQFHASTNVNEDEYGDIYYYNKIAAQTLEEIDVSPGAEIWDALYGTETDPKDPRPVYEWEDQQRSLVYESYKETRLHFNGEPVESNIHYLTTESEVSISKCIYCGGEAQYTGGAWCCGSCLAVYGDEEITESTVTNSLSDDVYVGEYLDNDVKEPNLEIAKNNDGTYIVQIGIYRLAAFTDGVGKITSEGLKFTASDPAGNPISGVITVDDQIATVIFTESTWDYLENGASFYYTKSSNIPDIWDY